MRPILELYDVSAFYKGVQALGHINMRAYPGQIIAILGANGAGKTTLLKSITKQVEVTGKILVQEVDLQGWRTDKVARFGVSHVPQNKGIFADLSVKENLLVGGLINSDFFINPKNEDLSYVYKIFPALKERQNLDGAALSGGEQQMLALARALMTEPKVLLLDEPSIGLAPKIVKSIFNNLLEIRKEKNVTIIICEQNVSAALEIADHIYVLENGQIVFDGSASMAKQNADIKKSYLGN